MKQAKVTKSKKFLKKCFGLFAVVAIVFSCSIVVFNSVDADLNTQIQKTEEKINTLNAKIDGLNAAKNEKVSFENVIAVAKSKGYSLNYTNESVASVD